MTEKEPSQFKQGLDFGIGAFFGWIFAKLFITIILILAIVSIVTCHIMKQANQKVESAEVELQPSTVSAVEEPATPIKKTKKHKKKRKHKRLQEYDKLEVVFGKKRLDI